MTTALDKVQGNGEPTKPAKKQEALPLSIHKAIPAIIGAVAPIAKNRKNQQQNYAFRGIDDVYAALNLLLAKYGVSILPTVIDSTHDLFATKSGAQMFRHRIRVRYTLMASDGTSVQADSEGEGMDTGDKATPKAFSTAFKTMAFQVFCIPSGEKIDSEEDSPEVEAQNHTGASHEQPLGKPVKVRHGPIWQQAVQIAHDYGFDCGAMNAALWTLTGRVLQGKPPKDWTEADLKVLEEALAKATSAREPDAVISGPEADITF